MAGLQGFFTTIQFAVLVLALTTYLGVKSGAPVFNEAEPVPPAFEKISKTPGGYV